MERRYEVRHDLVFEPWPVAELQRIVQRYRATPRGEPMDALRQELREFERHHPRLAELLARKDKRDQLLVDQLLETRRRREANEISEEHALDQVTGDVLRH